MEKQKFREECIWCKKSFLPNQKGPCPRCGKIGKKVFAEFSETIFLKDVLSSELRREFFEENSLIKWILIFISIVSPFLGLIISGWNGVLIGLVISIVNYVLGPYSIIKIREVTKERTP